MTAKALGRILFIAAVSLTILAAFVMTESTALAQDVARYAALDDASLATNLLGQLNAWRVSEGLPPLRPNLILEQMAIDQAAYIRSLMDSRITINNFHLDSRGRDPQTRAYQDYQWATYGAPERIEISENAAVGTVTYAINYWRNSDIHRRAALSQTFREAGVAAIPTPGDDDIFIVVFGARPGIIPAQISPERTSLYLSRENSRYSSARGVDSQVRIFGDNGEPLTPTLSWSSIINIPSNQSQWLYVLFTAGNVQSITRVNLVTDIAVLPSTVLTVLTQTAVAPSPTPTYTPTLTFTPTFTATLSPNITPTRTSLPTSTPTPTNTLPPTNTVVPTATLTPTVLPTEISDPDFIITYDASGLILRSVTTARPNISSLRLYNPSGNVTVARWLTVAPFPAEAFPANQCLVLYRSGSTAPYSSECAFVRSQVQVGADRLFWTTATFEVMIDNRVLVTCQPATQNGRCLFKLN